MSATENWAKLYRWWQHHLKSHFHSSSSNLSENDNKNRPSVLHRRSSLMVFRSSNTSTVANTKKRASFSGIEQDQMIGSIVSNGGFRHVRDSIRNKGSRTTRSAINVTNYKRLVYRRI